MSLVSCMVFSVLPTTGSTKEANLVGEKRALWQGAAIVEDVGLNLVGLGGV